MFLFCYYYSKTMENDCGSHANDDCAICRAWTKKNAIKTFQRLYADVSESNVSRVKFSRYGVAVLSDY